MPYSDWSNTTQNLLTGPANAEISFGQIRAAIGDTTAPISARELHRVTDLDAPYDYTTGKYPSSSQPHLPKCFGSISTQGNTKTPILVFSQCPLQMLLHPTSQCLTDIAIETHCGQSNVELMSHYILDVVDYMVSVSPALTLNLQHVCIICWDGFIVKRFLTPSLTIFSL